jgi:UrcA family protein
MTRFLTLPVLGLAAAAALSGAIPARAQTSDAAPSVTVRYNDLNIGSRAGAEVLLRRIETAANSVCGGAPDIRQLSQWAGFQACRTSAVERAVAAAESPMLTAMAHRRSPASLAAR